MDPWHVDHPQKIGSGNPGVDSGLICSQQTWREKQGDMFFFQEVSWTNLCDSADKTGICWTTHMWLQQISRKLVRKRWNAGDTISMGMSLTVGQDFACAEVQYIRELRRLIISVLATLKSVLLGGTDHQGNPRSHGGFDAKIIYKLGIFLPWSWLP